MKRQLVVPMVSFAAGTEIANARRAFALADIKSRLGPVALPASAESDARFIVILKRVRNIGYAATCHGPLESTAVCGSDR